MSAKKASPTNKANKNRRRSTLGDSGYEDGGCLRYIATIMIGKPTITARTKMVPIAKSPIFAYTLGYRVEPDGAAPRRTRSASARATASPPRWLLLPTSFSRMRRTIAMLAA